MAARLEKWSASKHALLWRSWGDNQFVVYHTGSGDTHLLNQVTAEVLRQLERQESDVGEVVRSVAESFDCEPDEEFARQIERLVAYLDDLGLIEPVP